MEIRKVPTTQRDREQPGPFKRRPRPKAGVMVKEPEPAHHPADGGHAERRLDVTA
jgi:hypothetical protein